MQISGKTLADHLEVVAINKRVEGVVLGPNFEATTADESDQILLHAESELEFKPVFGVMDVSHLAKVVRSFGEEMNVEYDEEAGKLVITGGGVVVYYQCAATDVAQRKNIKWKTACDNLSGDVMIDAAPEEGFFRRFDKYYKMLKPQLVELSIKQKKLVARLVSEKSHAAEVVVGEAGTTSKKKPGVFKINASALADVLSCVPEGGESEVAIGVGKALSIEFGRYRFFIEPLVEPEGVSKSANGGKPDASDYF
jgi:hypothetical protein